jgi:class 3 adenylate cyclase
MVDLITFRRDVDEEVSTILAPDFSINLTASSSVPHSDDAAITFPNIDQKYQGTKLIETTVLYVDMRRSTALSLKHQSHTVAKLYSAFVRAMTRCAEANNGEVRGIIGDRVMMLFNNANCYTDAIDTAILINSVCQYVLNKHFTHNEVNFGIGIDYGRMLATKTGIRRHGSAQQSYRSLVWLGRPANVASKLTDNANKPEEASDLVILKVAYNYFGSLTYVDEWPHIFTQQFTHDPARGSMIHSNPAFHSFRAVTQRFVMRPSTPAILMSKRVYEGFKKARPLAIELEKGWFAQVKVTIADVPGEIYGGNVTYTSFL